MSIAYKSQGAGAGTETNGATLTLVCPATVDALDILVAHVLYTGTTTGPSTPTGWTLLYGPADVGTTATARHWAFGKIADGSEDGASIGFGTAGGTAGRAGRIYSFSGYVSGLITQVIPASSFSSIPHATDPQGPSVTTTLVGALAVALTCQDDNNNEEAIAGASGGTWGGFQSFVDASLGPQGLHLDIQVATPTADPGTISGGAMVAANDESGTIGFEIRPVGIPVTADFSPYKTVVDGGVSAWDAYFENIACVVKFNDTYFLYYIGGDIDADIGDDWVYNRQVGVATSPDMINWTKYGGNPIVSFTPEGDQPEEGIGDCKCVVYDNKIHMYYSALRWRSGGDVDVEIRYRVSTDGFTFTDDTLIIDDLDEELYASGVYVTPGGTFHLWYAGPLTGGVGDLKKLSGTDPTSLSSDGTITTNDYASRGGVIPLDADNLLLFNDRFFDGSITCTLIKTSALGSLSTVFTAFNFGSSLELPGYFFYEDGQWFAFSTLGTSAAAPYDATQIILRTAPEIAEIALAASANIAANAATNTTAIMSAPAGKTTDDFEAGKISDDANPLPSINLTEDAYTEVEFCLEATVYAGPGVTYEFRITDNGTPLDTYTQYPELTIEAAVPVSASMVVPCESTVGLSAGAVAPIEAARDLTQPLSPVIEHGAEASHSATAPYAWNADVLSGVVAPYESQGLVAAATSVPVEAQGPIASSLIVPIEHGATLLADRTGGHEFKQSLSAGRDVSYEGSGFLAGSLSIPYEQRADMVVARDVRHEVEQTIVNAGVVPDEQLASVLGLSVPITESLVPGSAESAVPIESLLPLGQEATVPVESALGVLGSGVGRYEIWADNLVLSALVIPFESRWVVGAGLTSSCEWVAPVSIERQLSDEFGRMFQAEMAVLSESQTLVSLGRIAALEWLQQTNVNRGNLSEWLSAAERSGTIPHDILSTILQTWAPPWEVAEGALVPVSRLIALPHEHRGWAAVAKILLYEARQTEGLDAVDWEWVQTVMAQGVIPYEAQQDFVPLLEVDSIESEIFFPIDREFSLYI